MSGLIPKEERDTHSHKLSNYRGQLPPPKFTWMTFKLKSLDPESLLFGKNSIVECCLSGCVRSEGI